MLELGLSRRTDSMETARPRVDGQVPSGKQRSEPVRSCLTVLMLNGTFARRQPCGRSGKPRPDEVHVSSTSTSDGALGYRPSIEILFGSPPETMEPRERLPVLPRVRADRRAHLPIVHPARRRRGGPSRGVPSSAFPDITTGVRYRSTSSLTRRAYSHSAAKRRSVASVTSCTPVVPQ
jgi:hypothetical protein